MVSLAAACAASKNDQLGAGGGNGATTGPIKLGVVESLSGNLGSIGQAEVDGYKAAAAYINANGGLNDRKIELTVLDDGNDPGQAVTQVRQLFAAGAAALLGPVSASVISAVAPLVQRQKIPQLVGGVVDQKLIASVPYTVAIVLPATAEVPAIKAYVDAQKISKVGLIALDTPTGNDWIAEWKRLGGTAVDTELVDSKATDLTANAARLKSAGAQLIIMISGGTQNGIILSNLTDVGYSGQIVSYQGVLSLPIPTLTKLAGEPAVANVIADGAPSAAFGTGLPAGDVRIAQNELFDKWFRQTIGSASTEPAFSGEAWDALMLLAAAAKKTSKPLSDSAAWNAALHSLTNVVGTNSAGYSLDPNTVYPLKADDVALLHVVAGKWQIRSTK
jgi:branched-chain amino acid transport system substrate-binding protein